MLAALGNPVVSSRHPRSLMLRSFGPDSTEGELAFKGLDDAYQRAVFVAQRDRPGVHLSAVARFVVNKSHGFGGLGVVQGDRDRALVGTHFTAGLVAMLQNVVGAGMSQHINPRVARQLFRAVTPKDNFFLEIEHADTYLQAIEYVAANVGIVEGWHRRFARTLLISLSAESPPTSEAQPGIGIENEVIKPLKSWICNSLVDGTLGMPAGTGVPFAKLCATFNFAAEQFWGRAARAPRSRKRFEALVFGAAFREVTASSGLRSKALRLGFLLTPKAPGPET